MSLWWPCGQDRGAVVVACTARVFYFVLLHTLAIVSLADRVFVAGVAGELAKRCGGGVFISCCFFVFTLLLQCGVLYAWRVRGVRLTDK